MKPKHTSQRKEEINKFDLETLRRVAREDVENIMGKGKVIRETLDEVEKYALQDAPLLIEGETGVGKKEIVVYLHKISSRRNMPLVTIDCGSIHKGLIEGELFGAKKGAYTDAKEDRIGKIEKANGCIIFFDEINSLPVEIQPNILRLVQEKEIIRVGDAKPIHLDVRIIAAGNEDFGRLMKENRFRADLFYRFSDVIEIPTLKERYEDIDFFIDKFLKEKSDELNKKRIYIKKDAKDLLKSYQWEEGNVRQLKNFIHRLVTMVELDEKNNAHIIDSFLVKKCYLHIIKSHKDEIIYDDYTWKTACIIAKKNTIKRAMERSGGNVKNAIRLIGISIRTYYDWNKEIEMYETILRNKQKQ
jgi:transcriptional regulator with PAS, ATPase and Fis domain